MQKFSLLTTVQRALVAYRASEGADKLMPITVNGERVMLSEVSLDHLVCHPMIRTSAATTRVATEKTKLIAGAGISSVEYNT